MQLTTESLRPYVGGQMEIQNREQGYLYVGKVEDAKVEGQTFRVRFAWLAKGEGWPPLPQRWVKADNTDYIAGLRVYTVSDIGNRSICLNSPDNSEMAVLHPPEGSRLEPSKVEGLDASA